MRIPSNMQNTFAQAPKANIQRSTFDRSSTYKTTFNAGFLIPVYLDFVIPGDTFDVNATTFARLATPITPYMDNLFIDYHTFFVPMRLLWDNFERFMGAQDNPGASINYVLPKMSPLPANAPYEVTSLADYLGIPTNVPTNNFTFTSLPFRAVNLIWNTWYRDQNLQNSLTVPKGDGPDSPSLFGLLKRGKRHDYFTSALPQAQKFNTAVGFINPIAIQTTGSTNSAQIRVSATGALSGATALSSSAGGLLVNAGAQGLQLDPNGTLQAVDVALTNNINTLRSAFQLQQFLETDMRGGTRYIELIRSHFGVINPDYRLQRPEFIHGSTSPVNINPVAQMAPGTDPVPTPQGNLAAYGTHSASIRYIKSFTEHGYIITFASARADLNYQNGLDRHWSYNGRLDFFWPEFAHLGEQLILNQELQATNNTNTNITPWGWQERYAEYRFKVSKITGKFKSQQFIVAGTGSLDFWHLAQSFIAIPTLSDTFIQESPPVDRIIAVPSEPHFIFDSYWKNKTTRAMPIYGIPQSLLRL